MNQQIIKQLLDSILEIENYHEVLPLLFEKYISEGKTPLDLQDFNEQFNYTFNSNPFLWSEVFGTNAFPKIDDLGINKSRYNSVYKLVLKLKALHGAKFMRLLMQTRDPFALVSTNVNIKHNDTTHTITFVRGDLNSMAYNFNVESLLGSMIVMQQSLSDSLRSGLFILTEDTVKGFLETNNKLVKTLNDISSTPDLQQESSKKDFN